MTEKAVILARGLGTRMRAEIEAAKLNAKQAAIASKGFKTLIPIVGDKSLLDFILESLSSAGIRKICLVVGEEQQAIRDYCKNLDYDISFAIQEKPIGTANAVASAEEFAGNDSFLVVNSDNLYPVRDLRALRNLGTSGLVAYDKQNLIDRGNITTEKINKFALLDFDENDTLKSIIEKPVSTREKAFISMNAWCFSSKIFEAAGSIEISIRGEFELADAVNFAIRNLGEKFKAVFSNDGVLDLSSRDDIESVVRMLKNRH
jgi:glucose-1-phosphate thymidylyltransferase